jgi:hypothetical protein
MEAAPRVPVVNGTAGLIPIACTATLSFRTGLAASNVPVPPAHGNVGVSCEVPPMGTPIRGGGVGVAYAAGLIGTTQTQVCAEGSVVWPAPIHRPSQQIKDVCVSFIA